MARTPQGDSVTLSETSRTSCCYCDCRFAPAGAASEKAQQVSPIDLDSLPDEPWGRRAALLLHGVHERCQRAVLYLRDEYPQASLLKDCCDFVFTDLLDAPRSECNSVMRVWFFPWVEIQNELNEALNHLLGSGYKAALDNYRRALELAISGTYFAQARVPEKEGKAWLRSEARSPHFSNTLAKLLAGERFKVLDEMIQWRESTQQLYRSLCDSIHIRGTKSGRAQLQPSHLGFMGMWLREHSDTHLARSADQFIKVVQHIATVAVLENPILMFGVELDSKFGINPPMCGYFSEHQAQRLGRVLPEDWKHSMLELAEKDEEVQQVRQWLADLPELTQEELAEQVREFKLSAGVDTNADDGLSENS
jgi:hypothetical protein